MEYKLECNMLIKMIMILLYNLMEMDNIKQNM